jgi:imidazolonepropionase-like amidohydrolase
LINAVTVTAAEAIGRYGDLIRVAGDPVADVAVLQSVSAVMKGGAMVRQEGRAVLPH